MGVEVRPNIVGPCVNLEVVRGHLGVEYRPEWADSSIQQGVLVERGPLELDKWPMAIWLCTCTWHLPSVFTQASACNGCRLNKCTTWSARPPIRQSLSVLRFQLTPISKFRRSSSDFSIGAPRPGRDFSTRGGPGPSPSRAKISSKTAGIDPPKRPKHSSRSNIAGVKQAANGPNTLPGLPLARERTL